jgi:hypothetical protein
MPGASVGQPTENLLRPGIAIRWYWNGDRRFLAGRAQGRIWQGALPKHHLAIAADPGTVWLVNGVILTSRRP